MDFLAVCAFLLLYYIRPQEWIDGLGSFRPVLVVFVGGIAAMILRSRGFSLKELVKTPHDWLMAFFFVWIAMASAGAERGFSNIPGLLVGTLFGLWGLKNYMGFYFVVSQSLYSRRRLEKFIWVWLGMIYLVSLLAVLSEFGIDPMQSHDRTKITMRGRLVLNNGLFDNPNALGHGVIIIIPLIYLFCMWKRSPAIKQAALTALLIPLYCVYLTKSKGAYLSGSFTALVGIIFGRPKIVKLLVLATALTAGVFAIKTLPRMAELRDPRSEEGIQGRLIVFNYGYECLRTNAILGKDNFVKRFEGVYGFPKASHSGYNQIGAELGPIGFFIYLSIFYCALKTLALSKTRNIREERLRRVLMAAVAGFMASCWMIDLGYHGTYFFIMAAVAGFHRLMRQPADPDEPETLQPSLELVQPNLAAEQAGENHPNPTDNSPANGAPETMANDDEQEPEAEIEEGNDDCDEAGLALKWKRFQWVDLIWCVLLFIAAVRFWRYIVFSWGKA